MACHAILTNDVGVLTGKLCRNYSMNGCLFCHQHQEITPEEHKSRWLRHFIMAADGKPFLYIYREYKETRILGDLKDGIITLTEEDLQRIPDRSRYIDIYILLFDNGYINLTKNNMALYQRSILYIAEFFYQNNEKPFLTLSPFANMILEILILRDATHLSFYLCMLTDMFQSYGFQGDLIEHRIVSVSAFLNTFLDSSAAKQLSWEPFRATLLRNYETKLGLEHPVTVFFRERYLPSFTTLYRFEKTLQKSHTNQFKEEMMAVCWHPDRFLTWCIDEEEKEENRRMWG